MDTQELKEVDHTALKTNQAVIILLNIVAFVLDAPWLARVVTLAMLLGTFRKKPGFGFIYQSLKPTGWPKTENLMDNPEPHRFAQGFGAAVMLIGTTFLFIDFTVVGWGLVWLVVALAALNLLGGFCVGCALYYWLGRVNVPGFNKMPPEDTIPGMPPTLKA